MFKCRSFFTLILIVPFLCACGEIRMDGLLLNDSDADTVPGVQQYYKYSSYIWSAAENRHLKKEEGGFRVMQSGKTYTLVGGSKPDQYTFKVKAKHVTGKWNGPKRYVLDVRKKAGDKSYLYLLDTKGENFTTYVNTYENLKKIVEAQPYPIKGAYKWDGGIEFDANISKGNKQAILSFMMNLSGEDSYAYKVEITPSNLADIEYIWKRNKEVADAKKKAADAKKAQKSGTSSSTTSSPGPSKYQMSQAIKARLNQGAGGFAGANGVSIKTINKIGACTYMQPQTYRCSYKIDYDVNCDANPALCLAGGMANDNKLAHGIFTKQSSGRWYFSGAE